MSSKLYYEDDLQFHNNMLQNIVKARESRVISDYQLGKSLEAIDAIADLIKIKATKQAQLILNDTGENDE